MMTDDIALKRHGEIIFAIIDGECTWMEGVEYSQEDKINIMKMIEGYERMHIRSALFNEMNKTSVAEFLFDDRLTWDDFVNLLIWKIPYPTREIHDD
ncbi:hypothetical protein [Sphingobium yanoikuyae]|uniref:hypothetical protein n=1 Tax=Sphingobium yanoikuyae TaxID=13690 RepID=UPI000DB09909|nr:MAG: hypothetical protein DI554_00375 [Sphingobium sp.]